MKWENETFEPSWNQESDFNGDTIKEYWASQTADVERPRAYKLDKHIKRKERKSATHQSKRLQQQTAVPIVEEVRETDAVEVGGSH